MPDEWGSGTWKDGVSALNFKANGIVDTDPDTGICYNYQRWDDYLEKTSTKLKEDWSAHNDGDTTEIEHFEKTGNLLVLPGTKLFHPSTLPISVPSKSSASRQSLQIHGRWYLKKKWG